ncbi:hypothetical protein JL09_g5765 [Pichia kudriavzevii]|uniref:Uncharacterized protein n=1 Tax=Pichia kudriavzevii TaxID=4909 RepID=A0A099NR95_PICKU|nr:hypothetical protein JL09_g5765 [Pichia kudriavzevii]
MGMMYQDGGVDTKTRNV